MKYSFCVLILFFVFSFVLNKTDVKELKDGVEETINIEESDLYVGFRIYKNGYISLIFKKKQDNKLKKEDITIGLYNSLEKDGPNYSNDITFTALNDEYSVVYKFEKGDNEFLIVHIKNLTPSNATIKIGFYTKLEAWAIAAIVLASLLCVLIIVICICKKFCCCK